MEGNRSAATSGLGVAGLAALHSWPTSGFQTSTSCSVIHSHPTCLQKWEDVGLELHRLLHTRVRPQRTQRGQRGGGVPLLLLPLALLSPLTQPLLLGRGGSSPPWSHHDSLSPPGTLTLSFTGFTQGPSAGLESAGRRRQSQPRVPDPPHTHPHALTNPS